MPGSKRPTREHWKPSLASSWVPGESPRLDACILSEMERIPFELPDEYIQGRRAEASHEAWLEGHTALAKAIKAHLRRRGVLALAEPKMAFALHELRLKEAHAKNKAERERARIELKLAVSGLH